MKAYTITVVEQKAELQDLKNQIIKWEKAQEKEGKTPSPFYREKFQKHVNDFTQRAEEHVKTIWGITPQNNLVIVQNNTQNNMNKTDATFILHKILGDPDELITDKP